MIRNLSGKIGIATRRFYYQYRLGSSGRNLVISEGVYFNNPKDIFLGDNVWIDRNCILIAGKVPTINLEERAIDDKVIPDGCIYIGSNSHIGIRTVIQGHGGVSIGENFTSSTDVKIYSLSNSVVLTTNGTNNVNKENNYYQKNPIYIGHNVWLGLNSCFLGGSIGNNVFAKPNSVIYGQIESNSIIGGFPASKVKERHL